MALPAKCCYCARAHRMKRIVLILVTMLASAVCLSVQPQTSPKPILVDEHPILPCDDSLARLDAYFNELQNAPASNGIIIITNTPEGRRDSAFRQALIESWTRFRNFDRGRFKIIRANSVDHMKIQFWMLPAGAKEPPVEGIDMSLAIPKTAKPFIFTTDETWDDGICPGINGRRILVEFLKQNPRARVNIVSRDASAAVAQRRALKAASRIIKSARINRSRIRTFLVKPRKIHNTNQPLVEYWYLP